MCENSGVVVSNTCFSFYTVALQKGGDWGTIPGYPLRGNARTAATATASPSLAVATQGADCGSPT